MNRRGFLGSLLAATAALAVDPELAGWTKQKTIFIPPASRILAPTEQIAVRFMRVFDPIERRWINRYDALLRFGEIRQVAWVDYLGEDERCRIAAAQQLAGDIGIPAQRFLALSPVDSHSEPCLMPLN